MATTKSLIALSCVLSVSLFGCESSGDPLPEDRSGSMLSAAGGSSADGAAGAPTSQGAAGAAATPSSAGAAGSAVGSQPTGGGGAATRAVWSSEATKLAAECPGDGFAMPGAPGSECKPSEQRYTYDVATKRFSFEQCRPQQDPAAPLLLAKGAVALADEQVARLEAALAKVALTTGGACASDAPTFTMTVTTATGSSTYHDSIEATCRPSDRVFVDNMGGVFDVLGDIASAE